MIALLFVIIILSKDN